MNPSILLTPKPSIPFSPFITLTPQITLHNRRRHRFRYRQPTINCSSSSSVTLSSDVFGEKKELTGLQTLVDSMSPPVRLISSVLIFAGAVSAGYGLGFRIGGSGNASLGGAVALGAAGAGAAYALNSSVPEVAAIGLHNYVAGSDPTSLKKDDIDRIASKYGVSKQNEAFNAELSDIYYRYVSAVLPSDGEDLKGDEANLITSFKDALGIDDPDAAAVHMEIGRRIFRQRLETGDRGEDTEQRRAFQKLIYVSTLVFGEASSFLLPWKRVFKVTDSQVEVAIRGNAQQLYASKLKLIGQDITAEQLIKLRDDQLLCRLSDEVAEVMFRDHMRKLIEENIAAGLNILKSRQRTAKEASLIVEELNKVLAFNNLLISLKNHTDASHFAPGLGPVSLLGGEYDSDRKIDDLKVLYRAYLADSLSGGHVAKDKLAALNQLKNIFGLGKKETESITLDVTTKLYRKRLAQALTDGSLEAADSKAGFLQNLCEGLRFDPQKATVIHEEIYRQKLQQSVSDGQISEVNLKALETLQVLLCIPKKIVAAAKADICDSQFEKVVWDAIAAGVGGYDDKVKQSVRKAAYGLRLSREAALSIAGKAVRKIFMGHIRKSDEAEDTREFANALKKMISFNSLVVTKLVEDIKGKSSDPIPEKPLEEEKIQTDDEEEEETKPEKEEDEWRNLESLQKVLSPEAKAIPRQTEITLKKDLSINTRATIYQAYLLYARTGDVRDIPFGASVIIKNDEAEYLNLYQLAGILGLSDKNIMIIHKKVAQEDFEEKAEDILADGKMTEQKMKQLNELREKIGLPSEYSQKIIKSITTSKFASALETAMAQGSLGIKEIKELKESGVDVDSMVSRTYRENLYVNAVEGIFSSGTGEFDEELVCEKLPKDLNIKTDKARTVVEKHARKRSSNTLLQAVSQLRQRDTKGVISSLNDLLACDKAVKLSPLSWERPEELGDLFLVYAKSNPQPGKLSRIQYLLNISESTAEALRGMKDQPVAIGGGSEEEFVF